METFSSSFEEAKAKFEGLRKRRLDEFMKGFHTISQHLKEMYQVKS
jgi:structural maintenance of chromosome 4